MIDWARIDELCREIGADGFAEVVEIFLEEVAEALGDLATLPPGPGRARRLHFLTGSALNLGFVEMAALCRAAEVDQDAIAPGDIAAAFDAAKEALFHRVTFSRAPAA